MSKYQIMCPSCNTVYNVSLAMEGKQSSCKKCSTAFVIPPPPEEIRQQLLAAQQAAQSAAKRPKPQQQPAQQQPAQQQPAQQQPAQQQPAQQQPIPQVTPVSQPAAPSPTPVPTVTPKVTPANPGSGPQGGGIQAGPAAQSSPYEDLVSRMMQGGAAPAQATAPTGNPANDYLTVNKRLRSEAKDSEINDGSARFVFRGMSFTFFSLLLFGFATLTSQMSNISYAGPIAVGVACLLGFFGAVLITVGFRRKPGIAILCGCIPAVLFISGGVWGYDLHRNGYWKATVVASGTTPASNRSSTTGRTPSQPNFNRGNNFARGNSNRTGSNRTGSNRNNSSNKNNTNNRLGTGNNFPNIPDTKAPSFNNNQGSIFGDRTNGSGTENSKTNPPTKDSNPIPPFNGKSPSIPSNNSPRTSVNQTNVTQSSGKVTTTGEGIIKVKPGKRSELSIRASKMKSALFQQLRGFPKDKFEKESTSEVIGKPFGPFANYLTELEGRHVIGLDAGLDFFEKQFSSLVPVFSRSQPFTEIAKSGYAVGGLNLVTDKGHIVGVQAIYMKIKSEKELDPNDKYEGEWINAKPRDENDAEKLDGNGKAVHGIVIESRNGINSLALFYQFP